MNSHLVTPSRLWQLPRLPGTTWPARLAGAMLAAWAMLVPAAQADIVLTFGTYAADKPTETVRKYRPMLSFLSEHMTDALAEPVIIKMKVAKEYFQGIESLANGTFDFARFGPASYVMVKQENPGIRIAAMEAKKGKKRFKGVIIVHKDSDIDSLSDLKGHSFAFGDELSTIGRYLAQSHLLDAGVTGADLSDSEFLGRHDIVGEAVGAGRFTAGALKESTYKKLVAKGVPIRVLFTFDNVTKPWLVSDQVPDAIFDAMQGILLDPDHQDTLQDLAKSGFLPGTDNDYDFVRQSMHRGLGF